MVSKFSMRQSLPMMPAKQRRDAGMDAVRAMPAITPGVQQCPDCEGTGTKVFRANGHAGSDCIRCRGLGFFGIDPSRPTEGRPGSLERVAVLRARYEAGFELWRDDDAVIDEEEPRAEAECGVLG